MRNTHAYDSVSYPKPPGTRPEYPGWWPHLSDSAGAFSTPDGRVFGAPWFDFPVELAILAAWLRAALVTAQLDRGG